MGNIALNKVRILAIDDEVKALDLFKLNLEVYGFDVLTASSGLQGLEKAEALVPDLILLDIRMPEIDGWEICRRLKLNSKTKHIPVVFLTAFSSSRDRERAENLGGSAYLTKPVDPDLIVELIKGMLIN